MKTNKYYNTDTQEITGKIVDNIKKVIYEK